MLKFIERHRIKKAAERKHEKEQCYDAAMMARLHSK